MSRNYYARDTCWPLTNEETRVTRVVAASPFSHHRRNRATTPEKLRRLAGLLRESSLTTISDSAPPLRPQKASSKLNQDLILESKPPSQHLPCLNAVERRASNETRALIDYHAPSIPSGSNPFNRSNPPPPTSQSLHPFCYNRELETDQLVSPWE